MSFLAFVGVFRIKIKIQLLHPPAPPFSQRVKSCTPPNRAPPFANRLFFWAKKSCYLGPLTLEKPKKKLLFWKIIWGVQGGARFDPLTFCDFEFGGADIVFLICNNLLKNKNN